MGRKQSSESSLDLLLDTITNTFGGVLFLAILVSLMLRHVGKATVESPVADPMTEAEQIRAETRVSELRRKITAMQQELGSLPDVDRDVAILREELERLAAETDRLVAFEMEAISEIAEAQRHVADLRVKLTKVVKDSEEVDSKIEATKEMLEAEQAEAIKLARAAIEMERRLERSSEEIEMQKPVVTETSRSQVGLYLRFGRLYMMHQWSDGLIRQGPNPEHFFIEDDGEYLVAKPRPAAGVDAKSPEMAGTMLRWLRPFRASDWVVAVVTYDDSFLEFQQVKAALVRAGYKYRPLPVAEGNPVIDAGGQSVEQ
jgi:hypothetical protein